MQIGIRYLKRKRKRKKMSKNKVDLVNAPPHYNNGGIECIDYIKQQLGANYPSYLEGNAIKYLHRHKYKDANIQDLEKSIWYINKLKEHYENL